MEEINKRTLIESLSSLPEYDPPAGLWDSIDERLNTDGAEMYSRQDLRGLPVHEPKDELWDSIEQKLEKADARIVPIGLRRAVAVAASLALLLGTYWMFTQDITPNKATADIDATISYSKETVNDLLLAEDWNEDEGAFEEFKQLCEAKKYVCEHPEFQVLKSDLDELTIAKEEIQEAIGAYGTDPALVIQIKEIELERTDILKKMMVMLI